MNILLTSINSKYIHQNLAIHLLYTLNKSYEGLSIKEFSLKNSTDEIASFCSTFQFVAFSCYIWNIEQTLKVAKIIKQTNPECKILFGGPEVSYNWEEIIALPNVDFIILEEGETPFTQFLASYPQIESVPGLVWKTVSGQVHHNPPVSFDLNLYQNVNPYLNISDDDLQHKICYIEASRGCPNCCEFCLAGLQNKVRYLPIETLFTNLLYLMQRGKVIKFLDRTFNTHPDFSVEVFRFILKHYKPGNIFQFEIKADILQKELIEFIRNEFPKGVIRFEIGIQTLNIKSNQNVKRKQNFENIKSFIRQIEHKVEIHLDLIVGLPYDYMADIKYSFEEVFKLFAPELQLGFLKFLKGTPIRKNYLEHGYNFDALPPYQIIDSNYLSRTEIEEINLIEHVLDIYWNKKRATRTLRYIALNYSIFDFLKKLGLFWKVRNKIQNIGLSELYHTLYEFSLVYLPNDHMIIELIALDYYLQHKIKPATHFLAELSKVERNKIIKQMNLNHHKFRFIMHHVHFSIHKLMETGIVEPSNELLIIEYSGVENPKIKGIIV